MSLKNKLRDFGLGALVITITSSLVIAITGAIGAGVGTVLGAGAVACSVIGGFVASKMEETRSSVFVFGAVSAAVAISCVIKQRGSEKENKVRTEFSVPSQKSAFNQSAKTNANTYVLQVKKPAAPVAKLG